MADALESFHGDFERITSEHDDYLDALCRVLRSSYDLTEQEVLRNRVLVAEQGLIGISAAVAPRGGGPRACPGANPGSGVRVGDVPRARHGAGSCPQADARLLTRAVLGLYNSIWHWYRPRGTMGLDEIADFFVRRQLAVLSLPAELADRKTATRG